MLWKKAIAMLETNDTKDTMKFNGSVIFSKAGVGFCGFFIYFFTCLVALVFTLLLASAVLSSPAMSKNSRVTVSKMVPGKAAAAKMYPWPRRNENYEPLSKRATPPAGFKRVKVGKDSYAYWLRHLPLLPKGAKVKDYKGSVLRSSSAVSWAVVDLDVGKRDLQQCIDVLMRLRAEYLWWSGKKDKIAFRYAGGKYVGWKHWRAGLRPKRRRRKTVLERGGRRGSSRKSFRAYLTFMFAMTGTMHHVSEPRVDFNDMKAGDFFIQPPPRPGSLGHAVVILDLARNSKGEVRALIGEGFTPAQDFHLLKAPDGERWYKLKSGSKVRTPQWSPFKWSDLARFRY